MDLKILCFLLSSKQNASTFLLIRVLFISKPQCTKKPKCGNRNNGNHWRAWEISKTVRELSSYMGSIVMMFGRYGLHYHDISMHLRGFGLSSSCLWVNKCKRATVRNGLPFISSFVVPSRPPLAHLSCRLTACLLESILPFGFDSFC